jgi:NIPSNAP
VKGPKMLGLALAANATAAAAQTPPPPDDHPVIELRQYKIVPGRRDAMVALFEREFVESQEVLGARLVGQYRDLDDPNRFTWIRAFPDMATRETALNAFYFGPVWQAHRNEANPLLDDNDNVLLLRPAWPDGGFAPPVGTRAAPGAPAPAAGVVTATIYYLWKDPNEGFARFFQDRIAPRLAAAGLAVLGAYLPEAQPNNFPRLPVRQGEKVFVWFTRTADRAAFDRALAALARNPDWQRAVAPGLADAQERPAQVLHLAPTPRSLLR